MVNELPSGEAFASENTAPPDADLLGDAHFVALYCKLHSEYTPRQRAHRAKRAEALERAHHGVLPQHRLPSAATEHPWTVTLPSWCEDQRNLMSCPSDDLDLVVKGINSGAPAILLDLEDSVVNEWPNIDAGSRNIIAALEGELPGVHSGTTAIFVRVRGLHISQRGINPRRADLGIALRSRAYLVQSRHCKAETPLRGVDSQIRIRRRSTVVARRLYHARRFAGTTAKLHQVHGNR